MKLSHSLELIEFLQVSQKKHNLLSMYDLTEFKKDGGDLEGGDNAGGSFVKYLFLQTIVFHKYSVIYYLRNLWSADE